MFDDDDPYEPEEPWEPPRDRMVDVAKAALMGELFVDTSTEVYYGRQIEILYERRFFHWITKKALNELSQQGLIKSSIEALADDVSIHMYWPRRHRYPRRQIGEIVNLVREYSTADFAAALGEMGESLFDTSMARIGFTVLAKNVREWNGRRWTASNHNLDRVVARDGMEYGVEIKNTLAYISKEELDVKLRMCGHFGVIPFMVSRAAPKNYSFDIINNHGGFTWQWGDQYYPSLATDLARRVRERLQLPVKRARELPDRDLVRFVSWHEKRLIV